MRVTDDIGWSPGTYTTFTVSFFGLFLWVALSTVSAARPLRYTFPTFLETPNNITAVLGSDVTLPCSVQNLGTKSVIWKKTDNLSPITIGEYVYSPDKRFSISRVDPYMDPQSRSEHHRQSHDNPRWNLQIQDVSFTHAGTYECQLSTKEDYGRNVTLHVIEDRNSRGSDKKTGIKLTGTNYVEKGATIDLNCTAIAIDYTPKGVDWFKDGIRIKEGRNTLITEYWRSETNVLHSRLEVERVTMEDAGTYVCRFSHEHVESVKVIVLNSLSDLMASSRQVADSSNKRRGTGTDGLERASSENQLGHNLGVAAVSWHWSLHLLGSFIVLVCLS